MYLLVYRPIQHSVDVVYERDGRPTVVANATRDVRAAPGSLPVSEAISDFCFGVPWFKRYRPEIIDEYVAAIRKVAAHADSLRA